MVSINKDSEEKKSHKNEIEMFLSPSDKDHSNIVKTEISQGTTVGSIAVKIGITPNQLIEMYQSPDGSGKCNVTAMSKDYDEGKGLESMRENQKKFEEEKNKPDYLKEILERGPKEGRYEQLMQANNSQNTGGRQ